MKGKSALYALAVVVLMGSMAVAALADHHETNGMYGPAGSFSSQDVGMSESGSGMSGSPADGWELREAMETGGLPERSGVSVDAVCCGGIDEPTIESGGQSFRPDIDVGP